MPRANVLSVLARRAALLGDITLALMARPGRRGSLLIPPASPGSEGDALLMEGLTILTGGPARSGRIAPRSEDEQWDALPTDPIAVKLLRTATNRDGVAGAVLVRAAAAPYRSAFMAGADVVDGAYGLSPLRHFAWLDALARRGLRTGVCGFSFRSTPHPEAVDGLRRMHPDTLFVARGEVSASRFRARVGRDCHVAPDLSWAALLDEFAADAKVALGLGRAHRFDARDAPGGPTIGVNLSPYAERAGDGRLRETVTDVVGRRRAAGAVVRLVPHDHRPYVSDLSELEPLAEALELPGDELQIVRGPALRRRIATCDVVLTGRMHMAISALAFGVPTIAFQYNPKFEDLTADPAVARSLRVIDPSTDGLERRLDTALDELLAEGRMDPGDLEALHRRQRVALDELAALLAS